MATNKRLRADLLAKLKVTPQRLSQRVKQIKRLYGPMTTEEGTYVIAHQEGLDLTKYLSSEVVDKVRVLIPQPSTSTAPRTSQARRVRSARTTPVLIAPKLELADALLPKSIATDIKNMANVYPMFYVFENSIRIVIKRILDAKHGMDWWSSLVPRGIQRDVNDRKTREQSTPWHGRRGEHEIFYTDFKDLRRILENNWSDFADLFPSREWIVQRLTDLVGPRNIIAHNNPLTTRDRRRIDLYFHDWVALLDDKKGLIP